MQLYFGFGANRDPAMIRAITGRFAIGIPAWITDFQLCIESIKDMPAPARRILRTKWGSDFVSYGITPKRHQQVNGRLWLLSDRQRECIREWELVGTWSRDTSVMAHLNMFGLRLSVPAVSEKLIQQKVTAVDGYNYKTFIIPKSQILQVAQQVRLQTSAL